MSARVLVRACNYDRTNTTTRVIEKECKREQDKAIEFDAHAHARTLTQRQTTHTLVTDTTECNNTNSILVHTHTHAHTDANMHLLARNAEERTH